MQINIDSASASQNQTMRLRVSGADNSTSNYYWSGYYNASNSTSLVGEGAGAQTSFEYGYMNSTSSSGLWTINIANPFATLITTYRNNGVRWDTTGSQLYGNAGVFNQTTSFTGLTIFPVSGTITGTIKVYGMNE